MTTPDSVATTTTTTTTIIRQQQQQLMQLISGAARKFSYLFTSLINTFNAKVSTTAGQAICAVFITSRPSMLLLIDGVAIYEH